MSLVRAAWLSDYCRRAVRLTAAVSKLPWAGAFRLLLGQYCLPCNAYAFTVAACYASAPLSKPFTVVVRFACAHNLAMLSFAAHKACPQCLTSNSTTACLLAWKPTLQAPSTSHWPKVRDNMCPSHA